MTRTAGLSSRVDVLRALRIAAIVLLVLIGAASMFLAWKWPFTRGATIESLERVSASDVKIGRFEKLYFPHPGYVAHEVTFTRDRGSARPLATVRKVTCQGSWVDILTYTHRVSRIDLEGAQVYIPRHVPAAIRKHPEENIATTVAELLANGTVLEIAPRQTGSQITRFDFPELVLTNVAKNKPIGFRTLMRNRNLIGDLKAAGNVGPLTFRRIAETSVSGSFQMRHTDLSTHQVIAGILAADGQFRGTLGHAKVAGRADIPNFEVNRSRHPVKLTAEYNVLVNGTNGDIHVESTEAQFLGSTLTARGSIAGTGDKTISLDLDGRQTRVEDVLRLFVKADRPPLDGKLTLHAHVVLPPKQEAFLKKVELEGDFAIADGAFTRSATEEKIAELSARALGDTHANTKAAHSPVTLEIKSQVHLQEGVATLSQAFFSVPGAVTKGGGTYNLSNEAIDLNGKLAMNATVSKAAGGIRSILLLPVDPFFKKDGAGAVLPVHVRGTYSHPIFKVSLK
jgi:AsmA-like C-terminal region